jgi:hypothetical protein
VGNEFDVMDGQTIIDYYRSKGQQSAILAEMLSHQLDMGFRNSHLVALPIEQGQVAQVPILIIVPLLITFSPGRQNQGGEGALS